MKRTLWLPLRFDNWDGHGYGRGGVGSTFFSFCCCCWAMRLVPAVAGSASSRRVVLIGGFPRIGEDEGATVYRGSRSRSSIRGFIDG